MPLRTGLEGPASSKDDDRKERTRFLPDNIYDAVRLFRGSGFIEKLIGEDVASKYAELKMASAERCPKALGAQIKHAEIQFHHEVTNQYLWNMF